MTNVMLMQPFKPAPVSDSSFPLSVAYDLPLRPNEAHIFYSNMSKVFVTLLGRTKGSNADQSELTSDRHCYQTKRYHGGWGCSSLC